MIIFDVNSYPELLSPDVWKMFFDDGLLLFDSLKGHIPLKLDDDEVSLVDINSVDPDELEKVLNKASGIMESLEKEKENDKLERTVVSKNMDKLITFLKSVNKTDNDTI